MNLIAFWLRVREMIRRWNIFRIFPIFNHRQPITDLPDSHIAILIAFGFRFRFYYRSLFTAYFSQRALLHFVGQWLGADIQRHRMRQQILFSEHTETVGCPLAYITWGSATDQAIRHVDQRLSLFIHQLKLHPVFQKPFTIKTQAWI